MSGIPEATAIILTEAERTELEGFEQDGVPAAATGADCAAGSGRHGEPSDTVRCTTGTALCAMPRSDLRASTRPVTGALSRSTQRQRANASWRCWISRRLRAM